MRAKYVNPFTDFGFKKLFGEDASKPQLMDFLMSLIPESDIADLSFSDKEFVGQTETDRDAIFDIYITTNKGEKIIVELQKAKQNYFKDRTVFYATFPIQEQAQIGDWNFQLKSVYCVGILDFTFNDYTTAAEKKEVVHTVQLKDQNNEVFYKKLKFVYLEMPNFTKTIDELVTRLDKWLYFIKHLESFQDIPAIFKDAIFTSTLKKAEIANYDYTEKMRYEYSLKRYRDNRNVINSAVEKAIDDTIKSNSTAIAKNLKSIGLSFENIATATGLSIEEIEKL